ncbi:bifunctional UDP-N-acetylglucosamine diphosphorylase/glucosamine-1-phosphate N-acetyltransferase GlmU [Liberibacter crescens]|uniref:bifunctional UDP-N-acetylglucosamine diphosphorylase/glucosamine-1-phosphate N-acetyltransferase GlmU n=1 Tax=Liberibacter crescens TaxID=1273132 RepID=UPI000762FF4B|nr:bifunctional UDP-N-acetylglucosamine diphosphorylase/glucosamine-1-phosphate N-acetyltransferase GlmU [Liberibacter crescens]AMC12780.1 bifunctional N-acetylglucosamine-1-phosphate uridyltransferase/glucosamine-1-phosphate acetyltransferase [Liberibacter crescens]
MKKSCLAIVLAAGKGTRMKSSKFKVLQKIANHPMISHVMEAISDSGIQHVALVVPPHAEEICSAASLKGLVIEHFVQHEQNGTAHAVLEARTAIARGYDEIIILYGDVPLISSKTIQLARAKLSLKDSIVVMGFEAKDPKGYGRLLLENNELIEIREEKDATEDEKKNCFCNSGLMIIKGTKILDWLSKITNNNKNREYYLTDLIKICRLSGENAIAVKVPEDEVLGCNNFLELSVIENIWQSRRRNQLMLSGVNMISPETVFLSYDTTIEQDTIIEPNVIFGCDVVIEQNVKIRAFSYLEGVYVSSGAEVGPFARLRPQSKIGKNTRIGNFCEIKQANIGEGTKINHLSYVGDTFVGKNANIGAGSITCNYDGTKKYNTTIGDNAFIGSNSALIAPVSIGNNAYVASGSVITKNVPENALAFGRMRQTIKENRSLLKQKKQDYTIEKKL